MSQPVIATDEFKVVIGLGATGFSCVKFLSSLGRSFAVVDSRSTPPFLADFKRNFSHVSHHFGSLDETLILRATTLIVSPGISLKEPIIQQAVAKGCKVMGDIDLFIEHADAPVIAITGSNAKSTVTTLVGEMAESCGYKVGVGGNIGIPALDLLHQPANLYVLELSSFQLERCQPLHANVATVLNVSPDHMDRYASMQEYHLAKHQIFKGAQKVVVNRDDPLTHPLIPESIDIASFGTKKTHASPSPLFFSVLRDEKNEIYLAQGMTHLIKASELKVRGGHNLSNALAALAIGYQAGFSMDGMLAALRRFKGLEHRCEWVSNHRGVEYFNDSKGTNIGATKAAIEGLSEGKKGKLYLIAGGVGKGADFMPLSSVVSQHVEQVFLFGESQEQMAEAFNSKAHYHCVQSLSEAMKEVGKAVNVGDVVLFSPACASFDMFKNFEHRGQVFKELVFALGEKNNDLDVNAKKKLNIKSVLKRH